MKRPLLFGASLTLLLLFSVTFRAPGQAPPGHLSIPSKKVSVSGMKVHFVEAGKGPVILFLHGLGGSWMDWSATLPAFAATHRVMALDFPGFGGSDKPEAHYSIEFLSETVEKFLQEQKIDGVNLVGHSMGGVVALNLASRPNARIRRLVVVDAVGIGDKSEFLGYVMSKKIMGAETRWESIEGFLKNEFRAMADDFIKEQKPRTAREFFESLKMPITGRPLVPMTPSVQMAASIIDFDIRGKLPSIRQPALILWGARDPVASPRDAAFLNKEIPSSTLVLFPDSGHTPMLEHSALFNQELGKFLGAGP